MRIWRKRPPLRCVWTLQMKPKINVKPGFQDQTDVLRHIWILVTRLSGVLGLRLRWTCLLQRHSPSYSALPHSNLLSTTATPLPPLTALYQSEHHYVALSASSGQTIDLCVPPRPRALTGLCKWGRVGCATTGLTCPPRPPPASHPNCSASPRKGPSHQI